MNNSNEWQYQYFNGWLPPGVKCVEDMVPRFYSDPEIMEACNNLDRNKVRIALWVRGAYPRHLLEECKS